MGPTTRVEWAAQTLLDEGKDVMPLLRAKCPAGLPMVLIGYSWGAVVGLAAVREEPPSVQAVGLIAPPINRVPAPMVPSRGDFARWPVLLAAGDEDEYSECSFEDEGSTDGIIQLHG